MFGFDLSYNDTYIFFIKQNLFEYPSITFNTLKNFVSITGSLFILSIERTGRTFQQLLKTLMRNLEVVRVFQKKRKKKGVLQIRISKYGITIVEHYVAPELGLGVLPFSISCKFFLKRDFFSWTVRQKTRMRKGGFGRLLNPNMKSKNSV